MNKNLILLLGIILLSISAKSQEILDNATYVSSNGLKYITIKDDFQFIFTSYVGDSPYTIKEKRKKEPNNIYCGSIGYVTDMHGNGTYSIKNGKLLLKFELDYSTIATKIIDSKLLNGISIDLAELNKLESEM